MTTALCYLPSEYAWKVVANRSRYENIGTIGNTGQPPTTSGHVPIFLEGIAVDSADGIYTVHDWDEAHFSVIKWSQIDGRAEFNTGNVVNEALLKGIAVEPEWFLRGCLRLKISTTAERRNLGSGGSS
jgi:hypothetical protein